MSNKSKTFGDLIAKATPKKSQKNAEDIALPVKGGRQTAPEGVSTLGSFLAELAAITPDFNIQLLHSLEQLAIYNGEVSYAVDNIKQLGNTIGTFPNNITFDDDTPDELIKEMISRLKTKSKKWYSGGMNALVNDLLTQTAINGALSAEIIPDLGLTGVDKVVQVAPKTIRFRYSKEEEDYLPYQISDKIAGNGLLVLNTITYKYVALQKISEKPYGIPPFIAALDNISISKDMTDNLRHVVKKLGVLGFLEVLVNGPKPKQGESDNDYFKRTEAYLNNVVPEIEKGMDKGYVVGFKGMHEFSMQNTTANVQGAKELIEVNDTKLMAGLKQDPLMFGRNFSTTETLGRVILAKMTTQVVNYQVPVAGFLEDLFLMDLQLAGYPIKNVTIEVDKPMIGDKQREAETRGKTFDNLKKEYNQGIISQETFALELGREKPDQDEPRQVGPAFDNAAAQNLLNTAEEKEDTTKTKDKKGDDKKKEKQTNTRLLAWQIETVNSFDAITSDYRIVDLHLVDGGLMENVVILNNEFLATLDANDVVHITELKNVGIWDVTQQYIRDIGGYLKEYEYEPVGCNCGDHDTASFDSGDTPNSLEDFISTYYNATQNQYSKATQKATKEIAESLAKLSSDVSLQGVQDAVLFTLYKNWGENFTQPQKKIINKFIKNIYTFFRKDSSIFKGADGIPKGTFGAVDLRAIDYYKKADSLYLGKFITDADLKKQVTQYLKDEYLTGDLPIGSNKKALAKFREKFGDVLKGQEWKLTRIISTTVNKMRNTAAVSYMQEADVEKFEIVGVKDRLQCAYCAELQGTTFSVNKAVEQVNNTVSSDPELIGLDAPFITSVFKNADAMTGLTSDELQAKGVGLPPYHPHCRDQVVASFDTVKIPTKDNTIHKLEIPKEFEDIGMTNKFIEKLNNGVSNFEELKEFADSSNNSFYRGIEQWLGSSGSILTRAEDNVVRRAFDWLLENNRVNFDTAYRGYSIFIDAEKLKNTLPKKGGILNFGELTDLFGHGKRNIRYNSFSSDMKVAKRFARGYDDDDDDGYRIIFKVVNKNGLKGIHLGDAHHLNEKEIIIGNGFEYTVKNITYKGTYKNNILIELEQNE